MRVVPSLLLAPLTMSGAIAADSYSVFEVPAVSWNQSGAERVDPPVLSPDGTHLLTVRRGATSNAVRWSLGGGSAVSSTDTPTLLIQAVDSAGYAVGSNGATAAPAGATFLAGTTFTNDAGEGAYLSLNDAGRVAGGLRNTPGNAASLRATLWASGIPEEPIPSTDALFGLTSQFDRISPDGVVLLGKYEPSSGDLLGFFRLNYSTLTVTPVAAPTGYEAVSSGSWIAAFADGTGILRMGEANPGLNPARKSWYWNGTTLAELPTPTGGGANLAASGAALPSSLSAPFVVGVSYGSGDGSDPGDVAFRWAPGESTSTLLADLVPAGAPTPYCPGQVSTTGQIAACAVSAGTGKLLILTPASDISISSSAGATQSETAGSFVCTIARAGTSAGPVSTAWPLTVGLSFSGSATAGSDFTAPASVTIPAGFTSADVTITLVNDPLFESAETVSVSIGAPAGGSYGPTDYYQLAASGTSLSFTLTSEDVLSTPTTTTSFASSASNQPSIPCTITFSEAVTGFAIGDVTVGNGSASALSGSGAVYTLSVTPSAQGAVTVQVPASVCASASGGGNLVSNTASITYDTIAPSPPSLNSLAPDTGASSSDYVTSATTPTIEGFATTGDIAQILIDGTPVSGATAVASAGAWSITLTVPLAEGTYQLSARSFDAAGNASATDATPATLIIDTTAPTTPTITDVTTNDETPTLSGTAEDSAVELFRGATSFGTGSAVGGSWSIDAFVLSDALHSIFVRSTDLAGNVTDSATAAIIVDHLGPTVTIGAPSQSTVSPSTTSMSFLVTFVDSPAGVDEGSIILNSTDISLTLTGTAAVTTVTINTVIGQPLQRSVRLSGFSGDGTCAISVASGLATDLAGNNASGAGPSADLTIDSTAPVAPVIDAYPSVTANSLPTLGGSGEIGQTIRIFRSGSQLLGTGTIDGSGRWSVTLTTALPAGASSVTAKVLDAGGNLSPASAAVSITLSSTGPTTVVAGAATSSSATIVATVSFSAAVSGFTAGDVVLGGTAGGTRSVSVVAQSTTIYDLTVSGMATTAGTVTIAVPADAAVAVSGGQPSQASNVLSVAWTVPTGGTTPAASSGGGGGGGCGAGAFAGLLLAAAVGLRRRRR